MCHDGRKDIAISEENTCESNCRSCTNWEQSDKESVKMVRMCTVEILGGVQGLVEGFRKRKPKVSHMAGSCENGFENACENKIIGE